MPQQIRRQSFPLRLSDSLKREAHRLADEEQISLNHFISLAVAEKLTRLEQSQIFEYKATDVRTKPYYPPAQTRMRTAAFLGR